MEFTLLLGTARPGRQSERVARFIEKTLINNSHQVDFVDVKDYLDITTKMGGVPLSDSIGSKWREIVAQKKTLLIVSPEYNHSFPGELKRLIDAAYPEYKGKHVGIIGVSMGPFGGARMIEQLQLVLIACGALLPRAGMIFPFVQELFNDDGSIKDPAYTDRVLAFIKTLE
ncbi:MAG TPA: NAD(P)H-dependent oxidoreductase [Candidatus Paceibacterota bacterium]|nr:NAD(P)H-dependent oxidoreductase [Candidatus Paceibacterota bacterium]